LVPNLGIVDYRDGRSFIMADIPGIIENAHLGKGLGHRFLKHIERNAVLLFMVPSDADHIGEQYEILVNELKEFNEELLFKPRILAITKSDLIDEDLQEMLAPDIPTGIPHIFISAVTGLNLVKLKDMLWKQLTTEEEENQ
jgi:GTP-binding protein